MPVGWRIDPSCGWFGWWCWWPFDEALWVLVESTIECFLAGGIDGVGLAIMHLIWRHQADADMMMILIIPVEEASAEGLLASSMQPNR